MATATATRINKQGMIEIRAGLTINARDIQNQYAFGSRRVISGELLFEGTGPCRHMKLHTAGAMRSCWTAASGDLRVPRIRYIIAVGATRVRVRVAFATLIRMRAINASPAPRASAAARAAVWQA